jgi:hypothetical protein
VRVVVSTVLLGSAILVQLSRPGSFLLDPFFFLIGLTYALSVIYLGSLRYVDRYPWLADAQLGADAILVSAFIEVTGGITATSRLCICCRSWRRAPFGSVAARCRSPR